MDNARLHRRQDVKDTILAANWKAIYLSPYSPEFNSIQKSLFCLKNQLRKKEAEGESADNRQRDRADGAFGSCGGWLPARCFGRRRH